MTPINCKTYIPSFVRENLVMSTEANINTKDNSLYDEEIQLRSGFRDDYQYLYHWMLFAARCSHDPDPNYSNCSDSDLQNNSILNLDVTQSNRIKKHIKQNFKTQTFKHKKSEPDKKKTKTETWKLIKQIALLITQHFPNIVIEEW
ncbi:uncharacterized protein LOC119687981 [Teleopsis dalmanni]|uniref:uncharacterized protein LOC119687981 n=1 Tax=Teleopsis dalmanni TaxID=139649 RepID=UPI0018CEC7D9|nr:uncharacterized protein LOC119687981 [Teleopsis dalmanni]XP_037958492.1 uncharacterized protein LOC119687981 [Teleopsis dalmanni]